MASLPYPFDPLSPEEIKVAVTIVKKAHGDVKFNVVSLEEPRKAEMTAWLANPDGAHRPRRVADVVVIGPTGKIFQGSVDLETPRISKWKQVDGAQPIVSPPRKAGCTRNIDPDSIDYPRGAGRRRTWLS
ncbi:peroxisomal copper amine oxidase [Fusarium falciforme]|nr:peroxisomal copper amine oxidase [Fusarium falciforme]